METKNKTYQIKMCGKQILSFALLVCVAYSKPSLSLQATQEQVDLFGMYSHSQELLGEARFLASLEDTTNSEEKALAIRAYVNQLTKELLPAKHKKDSRRIANTIIREANRYKMDPLFLIAVIKHESYFNPDTVGSFKEVGLMQIKPDTAEWLNQKLKLVNNVDLRNPVTNIKLGAAFFNLLRQDFKQNSSLYIAAYNMGKTNVKRLLKRNERPKIYAMKVMREYLKFSKELEKTLASITEERIDVAMLD